VAEAIANLEGPLRQMRTIYFVLRGQLEVIVPSGDGISMGSVALVGAGSVLGELTFFDGGPRSAAAWAVDDCAVQRGRYFVFVRRSRLRDDHTFSTIGNVGRCCKSRTRTGLRANGRTRGLTLRRCPLERGPPQRTRAYPVAARLNPVALKGRG